MGLFNSIIKIGLDIAETPLAVAKDVLTLGGSITENDKPYTVGKLEELSKDYKELKEGL